MRSDGGAGESGPLGFCYTLVNMLRLKKSKLKKFVTVVGAVCLSIIFVFGIFALYLLSAFRNAEGSFEVFNYQTGVEFLVANPRLDEYSKYLFQAGEFLNIEDCKTTEKIDCGYLRRLGLSHAGVGPVGGERKQLRYLLGSKEMMFDTIALYMVYAPEGYHWNFPKCPDISEPPTSAYEFDSCVVRLSTDYYLEYHMEPY